MNLIKAINDGREDELMNIPTAEKKAKHEKMLKVLECIELAQLQVVSHRTFIKNMYDNFKYVTNEAYYQSLIQSKLNAIEKLRNFYIKLDTNEGEWEKYL